MSSRLLCAVSVLLFTWACGGAGISEQRMASVEQQVRKLQEIAQAPKEPDPTLKEMKEMVGRMDNFEAAINARLSKHEDTLEALVKANAVPAAPPPASPAPVLDADVWLKVFALLGMDEVGVEADADAYAVKRDWLVRQIELTIATGQGAKLKAGKKEGVSITGIKPKTLPDQLGLKNADVILSVGEAPVASVDELWQALQKAKSPLSLKVKRKNKDVVLNYTLIE